MWETTLPLAHPWRAMRMTKPVWIFIGHHVRNYKLNQSTNDISTQVDDLEPMHGRVGIATVIRERGIINAVAPKSGLCDPHLMQRSGKDVLQ